MSAMVHKVGRGLKMSICFMDDPDKIDDLWGFIYLKIYLLFFFSRERTFNLRFYLIFLTGEWSETFEMSFFRVEGALRIHIIKNCFLIC